MKKNKKILGELISEYYDDLSSRFGSGAPSGRGRELRDKISKYDGRAVGTVLQRLARKSDALFGIWRDMAILTGDVFHAEK